MQAWNRFYPQTYSEQQLRMMAYLKIGILWGVAQDPEFWHGRGLELAKISVGIPNLCREFI